jgi:hypothetical protein
MIVNVPVSIGELVDKVTILDIKLSRSSGSAKENIEKEKSALLDILSNINVPRGYYEMLVHVNERLWEMEDCIRLKEKSGEFDKDFILYARMIYMYNDSRASIKRKINELTGSEIIEEKIFS